MVKVAQEAAPTKKRQHRPKARADGEGTLYQDKKRGLWIGELMVGWKTVTKPDGTEALARDVRKVSGKTQQLARERLDALKADHGKGTAVAPHKRTVGILLDEYLADCEARGLKPKTLFFYGQARDRYLDAGLKKQLLRELRPEHIRRWMNDQTAKGLSSTTVRNTRAVLNAALEFALRQEWIGRNPCDAVKAPKRRRPQLRPPTPDEMDQLVEAAEIVVNDMLSMDVAPGTHRLTLPGQPVVSVASVIESGSRLERGTDYTMGPDGTLRRLGGAWAAGAGSVTVTYTHGDRLVALWALAAHAGCRPGELLALRWSDVDLDAGIVTVQRNQSKVPGQAMRFDTTKTDRVRRIRIAPDAVAALRAHRKRQNEERLLLGRDYEDHGLVFALETGAPLLERQAVRRFKQALDRAGLPPEIRFYDMRHGNATAMLKAGVQPKAAADRLGHTSVTLFNDTYAHMLDEIDADAAAKIQAVIGGRRRSAALVGE